MKKAIEQIDTAIKSLYNIDLPYKAYDFLMKPRSQEKECPSEIASGALLFCQQDLESENMDVGIYLNKVTLQILSTRDAWQPGQWTLEQKSAFSVAAEEISHFHYLLYHILSGRGVSKFELELQAEIDKFLLLYLANLDEGTPNPKLFYQLFEQQFENFSLKTNMSEEEKQRYIDASAIACRFFRKHSKQLSQGWPWEALLPRLRRLYRLSPSDKVSQLG